MGRVFHRTLHIFTLLALGWILVGCQDAEYDAFRFGPNAGGDNSQDKEQLQDLE